MKIHHEVDPTPLRAAAYMDVGDQLDAIMKALAQLGAQGIVLPPETAEWIEHCKQVKLKYKKS
ncbi:hypothetical protein [Paraburkholderia sp.]|uniref:hypothetical protein n=1 Tax=Paraburkholderia sp. TaxID=1926495 RepID=UPI0039E5C78A